MSPRCLISRTGAHSNECCRLPLPPFPVVVASGRQKPNTCTSAIRKGRCHAIFSVHLPPTIVPPLGIRIPLVKRGSRVLRRRTRQAALDKPRVHDGQLGFWYTIAKKSETAENRAFEEKQPLASSSLRNKRPGLSGRPPCKGVQCFHQKEQVARAQTPAAFHSMDYHVHSTWIGSCNIDLDPAICGGGGRRPRSTTVDGGRRWLVA